MSSIREKAGWACACALALLLAAALAGAIEGGPLDPDNAPGATMKPLDQVEPRTPIAALPFVIDQAGSYYLTADLDLTAAGVDGVTVTAPYVTIDLNGFSLTGPGAAAGDGIAAGDVNGVRVFGGTLSGWDDGVVLGGAGSAIDGVTATGNTGTGLTIGRGGTLRDSVATGNAVGIAAQNASVTGNSVYQNGGHGIVVEGASGGVIDRNEVSANGGSGIYLTETAGFARIADNTLAENAVGLDIAGTNNIIIRNVVRGNAVEHNINATNAVAAFAGLVEVVEPTTNAFANLDN